MLRHELVDRGHAEEHVDALCGIADQLQRLAGIERAHDQHGAAGMQHRVGVAIQSAGVEQRQHREQHRGRRDIGGAAEVDAIPERHPMRDDRALGLAGGARGVHDGRDVIERDLLEPFAAASPRRCRPHRRRPAPSRTVGGDIAELGDRKRGLGEVVVMDHHLGRGVADDVVQLGNGEAGVERQEHRADPEAGELHLQRIRGVQRQHRDAVAARNLRAGRADGRQAAIRGRRAAHR